MKGISYEIAEIQDLEKITDFSTKACHSDIKVGAEKLKGLPGYSSFSFHKEILSKATSFL